MNERNRILIVDDEMSNIIALSGILNTKYKVCAVRDSREAVETAEKDMPDVILLDVLMPEMDGYAVMAELKKSEKAKDIPVIFITGLDSAEAEEKGFALGAADYISKPFHSEIVKHRVRNQIHIQNLQRDLKRAVKIAERCAEEAREAEAAAQAANQTKSSFLASMSHEIRTPMNAIMGITDILMQDGRLSAETADGLDKIYASSNMLLGIINDILDFSKIEAGKMEIMPAQYSVAGLVNDSVQLNIMRIGDKLIEFELEIDGEIPAKLIGDELRIKQVLNNLLSNAFKYTEQGKVTLSVSGTRLSETEAELVFCVRDTGCGMSEEQLAKLFDEYSRFCQESGRAIEGTGLGMAITQRLIRLMDSKIEVESAPGKGSVFTVRVPQKTVNGEVLSAETMESLRRFRFNQMLQKRKSSFAREPMPYGSVLVVDDVETNLYVAMGLMKLYRLKIDTARSGLEAIGKIKGGTKYDIVFMDHMMPGMDGMETTKRLRDMGYTEPIAALTANVVAGQAEVFLQNGFDDFIGKPIDIRQLDTILNKYIRDKQPPEVLAAARSQKNAAGAGGSPPQKEMLLDFFIEDARNTIAELDELKNCYDGEENLQRFFITVHGIKSSLQYIGKTELSDSANELECAAREQNIALIKESAPGFTDKLRGLLESIERERVSDEDGTDVDIGGLRGKLQDLAEMCGNYDRKGALDCIVGIAGCSPETRGILERIRGHIMHSEFEDAQSAAADYAGKLYALPYEIAGLDADKGLERCGGDIKLYRRILRSYASTVREMLGAIDCLDEDNLGDYILAAHSIKGASFDVFAEQVGETAKLLEAAGKERNLNCLRENSAAFVEAAGTLIDGIEKALSVIEAENPKPSKDKPDGKILAKLLYACRKYSMDDVDGAMEEIERYTYTNDDGLADWLKDNADRMNLTQIAERLSTL